MLQLGVLLLMIAPLVRTELLNRLDEKEKSSVAFRLQDEKEKRLLLQNDVDIIMLKIGQMERSLQELKQSKEYDCPSNWTKHEGSCYYVSERLATWLEAAHACQAEGGHLAEIESTTENEFLTTVVKTRGGVHWIGGTDAFTEGEWVWTKSMKKICELTRWDSGQPDNSGQAEHCLEINYGTKGNWNDRPCSYKEKYICEKN